MTIKFPLFKTSINVSLEDTDIERRRRKRRKKKNAVDSSTVTDEGEKSDASNSSQDTSTEDITKPQPVLMVEVENVTHEKFRQTEEVKVKAKLQLLEKIVVLLLIFKVLHLSILLRNFTV
jgi:Lon-like ATP-dependent protease